MVKVELETEEAVLELENEHPLEQMVRSGTVSFWSGMPREHFHRFLLRNADFKIERDKHGYVTIYPPMTYESGFYEGLAFTYLSNWSLKNRRLGLAFSPSTAFDLPDGSTHKADGAWVSIEKHKKLSDEQRKQIASIVPDFVMEVRSQSDRISKLKKKMEETWIANGVKLAWLIDPIREKAWVYRQGGTKEEIADFSSKLSGEDVLPGFEFELSEMKAD